MIPILYDDGERNFVTNGIGRLSDCISCTVTEERNGIYECEFQYPITGERYLDIQEGQIIYCTHDDTQTPQPFVIYGRNAPIDGVVTFFAHHISYRLRTTVVTPYTASSITDAINKLPQHTQPQTNFTFWTDKSVSGAFEISEPRTVRGVLGGEEGSLLDVYGKGDYEWDKFTVKLYQSRGSDSEIEIRYGKNLTNLTNEIDASNTYNAIYPFWKGESDTGSPILVTLPEGTIIYSGVTRRYAYLTDENLVIIRDENGEPLEGTYVDISAVPVDMSSMLPEQPTVAELRAAAESYLEQSSGWEHRQNITVDFVQMWQTEEYKDYAPLQRARLCDTVSVYYPELGVEAEKKKVIKTVYNVLMDRYDQIELGDVQYSYADIVTQTMLETVPTKSMMDDAIQHATEMISGGLGGYVVLKPNANGVPEEILVMDTPSIDTAVNVIRINRNGIGFSQTGYSGTYRTAWTIDGNFVADFITTGNLNANLITTGVLNADIIKAGTLSDSGGNTTFDLETGFLDINSGAIDLGDGNFYVDDYGYMQANSGVIAGLSIYSSRLEKEYSIAGHEAYFYLQAPSSFNDEVMTVVLDGNEALSIGSNGGFVCSPVNSNGEFGHIAVGYNTAQAYMNNDLSGALVEVNNNGMALLTGRSTTAHSGNLYLTGAGIAYYANEGSSSRKIKTDIGEISREELNPERLYDADVIQYKYRDDFLSEDDDNRGKDLVGFIVEDLDEVYPQAVQKEDEDKSETWTWSPYRIIPPMLKLIQDQKKEIDALSSELTSLKAEVEKIKEALNADS